MKVLPGYVLMVIAAMILLTKSVCGQITLTGAVRDTAKVFRVAAYLRLRNDSGGAIRTVLADSSGRFLFQGLTAGEYSIQCSYANVIGGRARLNLKKDTFIVVFVSGRDPTLLKAAVVTGSKPLIEREIDRIVFNVENSIAARGTDLLQALELTPLLTVSDHGISIIGKGGVSVMINGRLLPLRGNDLVNYLSSLRSDDVSRIEVITTPPARYEAQGNSGLVNIVLKKNPNIGWSGNVSSTYGQATYPGVTNSGSLNYRSAALSSSLKLRQFHRMQAISEEIDILDQDPILSSDSRNPTNYGVGANLSMEYKINKRSDIGFIYDAGKSINDIDETDRSSYLTGNITDSVLTTLTTRNNPTLTQMLNAYYDLKLDSTGKVMSWGFNYFYTTPNSTADFRTASDESSVADTIKNTSNFAYNVWSLQTDLILPFRWAAVETGAKFTNFNDRSQVGYYNFVEKAYTMDSSKSNSFRYDEKNIAGYLSAQKDLSGKWAAKAGLRYEYTLLVGYSPTTGARNPQQYGKLFPSAYLIYKPNSRNTFSLAYSERINRPGFHSLNPFRLYSNPYSYYTGNPFLQPSYNHNIELTYLNKGAWSLSLYGEKVINGYGAIVELDNTVKAVTSKNYLTTYSTGLEAMFSRRLSHWWETRDVMSFSYSASHSSLPQVLAQNGYSLFYSTYNTFVLCDALSLFANFRHSLPSTQANMHAYATYDLSTGIKLAMVKNKVQITVSGNDLFRTSTTKDKIYFAGFSQYVSSYYDSRRVNLNVNYVFGNSGVKGNRKQVNFGETQRAN